MHDQSSPDIGSLLVRQATTTVEQVIEELEPGLTAEQCRMMHRLRLAAESLGMLRAASQALTVYPDRRAAWAASR